MTRFARIGLTLAALGLAGCQTTEVGETPSTKYIPHSFCNAQTGHGQYSGTGQDANVESCRTS